MNIRLFLILLLTPLLASANGALSCEEINMIKQFYALNGKTYSAYSNPTAISAASCPDPNPNIVLNFSGFTANVIDEKYLNNTEYKSFTSEDIDNNYHIVGISFDSQSGSSYNANTRTIKTTNQIKFPDGFFSAFPYLTEIRMVGVGIIQLPDDITQLKHLKTLEISENPIEYLPANIGDLKFLEHFSVEKSLLKELPESLGNLSSLKKLYMGSTEIKDIPDSFFDLTQVEICQVDGNPEINSDDIDNLISTFTHLRSLMVDKEYNETCAVNIENKTLDDLLDPLPPESKIVVFDGETGDSNVKKAFGIKEIDGNSYLVIKDQIKFNELKDNIDVIVIKFECPQGEYYKRYVFEAKKAGIEDNATSVFNKESRCAVSDDFFMPTDFNFSVTTTQIGIGEKTEPIVTFINTPSEQAKKYLANIKYSIEAVGENINGELDPADNNAKGTAVGQFKFVAHSGKISKAITIDVKDLLTKINIQHPRMTYELGIKTLYLYNNVEDNFSILFTPNNPATKEITIKQISNLNHSINISSPAFSDSKYKIFSNEVGDTRVEFKAVEAKNPTEVVWFKFIENPSINLEIVGEKVVNKNDRKKYTIRSKELSSITKVEWRLSNDKGSIFKAYAYTDSGNSDFGACEIDFTSSGSVDLVLKITDKTGHTYEKVAKIIINNYLTDLKNIRPSRLVVGEDSIILFDPIPSDASPVQIIWQNQSPGLINYNSVTSKITGLVAGLATFSTRLNNGKIITHQINVYNKLDSCKLKIKKAYQHQEFVDFTNQVEYWPSNATYSKFNFKVTRYPKSGSTNLTITNSPFITFDNLYRYQIELTSENNVRCMPVLEENEEIFEGNIDTYIPFSTITGTPQFHYANGDKYPKSVNYSPSNTTAEYNQLIVQPSSQFDIDGNSVNNFESSIYYKDLSNANYKSLVRNTNIKRGNRGAKIFAPPSNNNAAIQFNFKTKETPEDLVGVYDFNLYPIYDQSKIIGNHKLYIIKPINNIIVSIDKSKPRVGLYREGFYKKGEKLWYTIKIPSAENHLFDYYTSKVFNNSYDTDYHNKTKNLGYLDLKAPYGKYELKGIAYDTLGGTNLTGKQKLDYYVSEVETIKLNIDSELPTNHYFEIKLDESTYSPTIPNTLTTKILAKTEVRIKTKSGKNIEGGDYFILNPYEPDIVSKTLKTPSDVDEIYIEVNNWAIPSLRRTYIVKVRSKINYLKLEPQKDTIKIGEELKIQARFKANEPYNINPNEIFYCKELLWNYSNPSLFTKDEHDTYTNITALSPGSFVVNIYDQYSQLSNSSEVLIVKAINSISVENDTIEYNSSKKLKFTIQPNDASIKDLNWKIIGNNHNSTLNKAMFNAGNKYGVSVQVQASSKDGFKTNSNIASILIYKPVNSITVKPISSKKHFDKDEPSIEMEAEVLSIDATFKDLIWSTNIPAVSIDQNGVVYPNGYEGEVTITATTKYGKKIFGSTTIILSDFVESIKINCKDTLPVGANTIAAALSTPLSGEGVTWTVDNVSILSIGASTGQVTALSSGVATIKATANDGSDVFSTKKIWVFDIPTNIKINGADRFTLGDAIKFNTEISPNTSLQKTIWGTAIATSKTMQSDASINSKGEVSATKPGWVTITAQTDVFGFPVETKETSKEILILPDTTGKIQLELHEDTVILKQELMSFIYNIINGGDPIYYNLKINSYDNGNNFLSSYNSFAASNSTRELNPNQTGKYTYSVLSTLDPNLLYKHDSIIVIQDTAKVAYDTIIISQRKELDYAISDQWYIKNGASFADLFDASSNTAHIIGKNLGTIVLERRNSSSIVTRTDSILVVNGVTNLDLNPESALNEVGVSELLSATIAGNPYNNILSWSVEPTPSDFLKVSNTQYNINSSSIGTYRIIVNSTDGSMLSDTSIVEFYKKVNDISFVETDYFTTPNDTIEVGQVLSINASVKPLEAKNKAITWLSSGPQVKITDQKNLKTNIVGVSPTNGSPITLTVQSDEDNSKKATILIHVVKLIDNIQLNTPDTIWISENYADSSIDVSVSPIDASNQVLNWISSDNTGLEITNISSNTLTAKARAKQVGNYYISVNTTDNSNIHQKKKVVVLKAITDININLSDEVVGFKNDPVVIDINSTTNDDASYKKISWKIIDENGDEIPISDINFDSEGNIIIKNSNQDMIIVVATSQDGSGLSVVSKDTIELNQLVTDIILDDEDISFEPDWFYSGNELSVDYSVLPNNASNKTINWSVDKLGLDIKNHDNKQITFANTSVKGIYKLRAEATDGSGVFKEKFIEVADEMKTFIINPSSIIYEGESAAINPDIQPSSSDPIKFEYQLFKFYGGTFELITDPNFAYIDNNTHKIHLNKINEEVDIELIVTGVAFNKYNHQIATATGSSGLKITFGNIVDSMKIAVNNDTIYTGEELIATATIYPSFATNKNIKWNTYNSSLLALVDGDNNPGKFEAIAPGEVEISAKSKDKAARESETKLITILEKMSKFTISDYKIVYAENEYQYGIDNIIPTTATERAIIWEVYDIHNNLITDEKMAQINSSGVLIPGEDSPSQELIIKAKAESNQTVEDIDTVMVHQFIKEIKIEGIERLAINQEYEFSTNINPSSATNKEVTWEIENNFSANIISSNTEKATLKGLNTGYVKLIALSKDGSNTKAEKTIEVYIPVTNILSALSGTSEYLHVGQTKGIITQLTPSNSQSPLSYKIIEGSEFLKLNKNNITGLKEGAAKIEIQAMDFGNLKDTIDVKVILPVTNINAVSSEFLEVGDSLKLDISINPQNATISEYKIIATNDRVTILDDGTIIGNSVGKVELIISSTDGTNITASVIMDIYQPVLGFDVEFRKIDKIYYPSINSPVAKGKRIVTKDSVEIYIRPYPENATNKNQKIEIRANSLNNLTHKNLGVGNDKVDYFANEIATDQIIVTSKDPKGVSKTIDLEAVKWIEKLELTRSREITALYSDVFLAPNIRSGILPIDASNKNIIYQIDKPKLAAINNYGQLSAKGVLGYVTAKATTTDGSNIKDSITIEIVNPSISLRFQDGKSSLPINYKEKLFTTTFPENQPFRLEIIEGSGEIDFANNFSSNELGLVKIVAISNYHHFELRDTLEVSISNKTLFIVSHDITLSIGDEIAVDYINYADETYWAKDSVAIADNLFSIDNTGLIHGLSYGRGKVYVENEVGSRDTAQVTVLLKNLKISTGLHLYPNPNTGRWLNIQVKNLEGNINYKIFDIKGNLIDSGIKDRKLFRVDLPPRTVSGRYLFEATDNMGRVERKWFVIVLQ